MSTCYLTLLLKDLMKIKQKGKYMSIQNIKQTEKLKVLLRLLDNNEKIETACSKAGLKIEATKQFLLLS